MEEQNKLTPKKAKRFLNKLAKDLDKETELNYCNNPYCLKQNCKEHK